jgi:hypothetical protein
MAAAKKRIMTGASSGHITNLKQSILETFNIYGSNEMATIAEQLFTHLNIKQIRIMIDKIKPIETNYVVISNIRLGLKG